MIALQRARVHRNHVSVQLVVGDRPVLAPQVEHDLKEAIRRTAETSAPLLYDDLP